MHDPKKLFACVLSLLLVLGVGFPALAFGDKEPDSSIEFVGLAQDQAAPREEYVAFEAGSPKEEGAELEEGEAADSSIGKLAEAVPVEETAPVISAVAAEERVSFVYVDQPTVVQSETQQVAVALLNEAAGLSRAELTFQNEGEERTVSASTATDSSMLFSFSTSGWTYGEWVAKSISYGTEDDRSVLDLSACDVARFIVVPSSEAAIATASDGAGDEGVSFYTVDASGDVTESSTLEGALAQSAQATESAKGARSMAKSRSAVSSARSRSGDLVVALDPGHGGSDSGAVGVNGVHEATLTWKIASYCKEELESYHGVKVVFTKTQAETLDSIETRVKRVVDLGADVVVSIHLNSFTSAVAHGAEVWVPNDSSYNHDTHTVGTALGEKILNELEALGLFDRGVKTKDSVSTDLTGHPRDYFGICRYAREAGIPGIIVEHAFISSPTDYELYLKDESKLRALGVADAAGIARQYGLSKQTSAPPTGSLKVVSADQSAGSITYEAQVSSSSGVSAVQLPVWCDTVGGQDDIRWYTMTPASVDSRGNGTYRLTVSTANHGRQVGDYQAHLYVVDGWGAQTYLASAVQRIVPANNASVTATLSSDKKSVTVTAKGGKLSSAVSVSFPVWSVEGGQDDIVWYPGRRNALDDSWNVTVPLSSHGSAGEYAAHCYMTAGGVQSFVGSTSFTHQAATGTVKVISTDQTAGTMVIQATVSSPVGVSSVLLPVWCTSVGGQDDIRWYSMAPANVDSVGRGTYRVTVNMANHAYQSGDYAAHLYVTDGIGAMVFADSTTQRLTLPPASVTARASSDGLSYVVIAKGGRLASAVSVSIPVWSKAGGQDDIVWYPATKNSLTGEWSVTVPVSRHGDTGDYAAHCYMMLGGTQVFVGETTFAVPRPSGSVKVVSSNESAGIMVIEVSASSSLGIRSIILPVWCSTVGGQDDIRWYSMTPYSVDSKGNGSYRATVKISDHGYQQGDYVIHAYAVDRAGIQSYVAETAHRMAPAPISIAAQKSSDGLSYTITASGGNLARAASVEFPTWSIAGGQDDIIWYLGTKNALTGAWTAKVSLTNHRTAGEYAAHCYLTVGGVRSFVGETSFMVSQSTVDGMNYLIMGDSKASAAQMVRLWNTKGKTYPAMVYTEKGADNIEKFCEILCEEAKAEGVKPEVLFAQVMLETGWLQFQGSSVKADQCNFGGIGATDGNPRPATFPDVRTGLRAQTQHLKAYASTDALRNPCVDPRFHLVKRGSATTVIGLSGKWASDPAYGTKLLALIDELSKY